MRGGEISFGYDNTFDGGDATRQLNFNMGLATDRTSFTASGGFSDSSGLTTNERQFQQRMIDTILANNPGNFFDNFFSPPLGSTTNIASASGTNLILDSGASVGSPITFVPVGYQGPASDAGAALIQNGGSYNFSIPMTAQFGGSKQPLLQGITRSSLVAGIRHEFTPRLVGFINLEGTESKGAFRQYTSLSTFSLSATDVGNPFQQPIYVTLPLDTKDTTSSRLQTRRGVVGAIAELPSGWKLNADYTWGGNESEFRGSGAINNTQLQSDIRSGALGVFQDLSQAPLDLTPYLLTAAYSPPAESDFESLATRAGGTLFRLPAGNVTLALAAERRRERLGDYRSVYPSVGEEVAFAPARSQTISGLYAEISAWTGQISVDTQSPFCA